MPSEFERFLLLSVQGGISGLGKVKEPWFSANATTLKELRTQALGVQKQILVDEN